jgi:hypothetical protein
VADYVPDAYEHLTSRARWARRAVFLTIPVEFVAIALSKVELDLVDRARVGDATLEEASTIDQRQGMIALVEIGLLVVGAVFFIRWFHRAYKNLDVLGAKREHGTGWAIGSWFVPIVSLFRPKQMADEIWKAGETTPEASSKPTMINVWWGFWVVSGILSFTAARQEVGVKTLDDLAVSDYLAIVVSVLTITAAAFAMRVVSQITERQEQRARELGNVAAGIVAAD